MATHAKLGFKQVSQFENVGMKFGLELGVIGMELLLYTHQSLIPELNHSHKKQL